MKDGFGREITYLRLSITDRCNLRCAYCMPADGVSQFKHSDILRLEESARLAGVLVSLGINKIRLTGGEPLVRKNAVGLVRLLSGLKGLKGLESLQLTTNGVLLSGMAEELKEAGLDGVNISLDTLDKNVYRDITRGGNIDLVLRGIEKAIEAGLSVRLNCVPVKGKNDEGIEALAEYAGRLGTDLRFIELMPLGEGARYNRISSDEIYKRLAARYGEGLRSDSGDGPSVYYRFPGFESRVGFISPLSHSFCKECNRLRLTADGFLKLCLRHSGGIDLKAPLREGRTDRELMEFIKAAVMDKPASHGFESEVSDPEQRRMIQIGG